MQDFNKFNDSDYISDAPDKLNDNFETIASDFAGTAFPTAYLVEGMTCYRTDEGIEYRYDGDKWVSNIATQAEAVEGTNDNKTMTPLKTKMAIATFAFKKSDVIPIENGGVGNSKIVRKKNTTYIAGDVVFVASNGKISLKCIEGGTTSNVDLSVDNSVLGSTILDGTVKWVIISRTGNDNPLLGKKISLIGDSICAGSGESTSYLGGYGKIIAERNNMVYENFGKGGSTITAETYSESTGQALGWICRMVDSMGADADYAIVEGGINDAWRYLDGRETKIGAITKGYNATLDDTTYYGAFESMLKKLVTKFQGKKIGYIAIPKTGCGMYDSGQNAPNFYHIALECCAKWGVPVCDLNNIVPSFAYLKTLGTTYTADGTHPTKEGYEKYYCDVIEAWMKTLTTGGNGNANLVAQLVEEYTKGFSDAIKALQDGKLNNTGVSFRKARLPLADGTTIEIDVLTAKDGSLVVTFTNQVPISIDTDGSIFNEVGYISGTRLSSSGATKSEAGNFTTGYIPAKNGDVIRVWNCKWADYNTATNYICAYDSNFTYIGGVATTIGSSFSLTPYSKTILGNYSRDDNANFTATLNNSSIAYIRVCSRGDYGTTGVVIDPSKMIVTVNEEIK